MSFTLTAFVAVTLLLATLPNGLYALEFQCKLPGDIRYLRVDIPGKEKLCEVSVKYEYNGENKVMWHAQNDTSYCTARAYELRDKYVNTWQYTCTDWPDRDGIDKLSPSQRVILDRQLKAFIERGKSQVPPYQVTGVKAIASTALDNTEGLLAFQYFTDSEDDFTEIVIDDGESWKLMTTLDSLVKLIDSDAPLASALVNTISDTGALEIHTTLADRPEHSCIGSQVLSLSSKGDISSNTSHQYVCHAAIAKR